MLILLNANVGCLRKWPLYAELTAVPPQSQPYPEQEADPHPVEVAPPPPVYGCPRCCRHYSNKYNLLRHLKLECGKEPQCVCPLCGYRTHQPTNLQRHMRLRHAVLPLPARPRYLLPGPPSQQLSGGGSPPAPLI